MEALLPGLRSAIYIHPMVVHLPLAFWLAGTLAWLYFYRRKEERVWLFGLWLHTLGFVAGIFAVASGLLASSILGHDAPGHEAVHLHRNIMIGAMSYALVLLLLAWWRHQRVQGWRPFLLVLAIGQMWLMAIGADRGAQLVYKHGLAVDAPDAQAGGVAPSHDH